MEEHKEEPPNFGTRVARFSPSLMKTRTIMSICLGAAHLRVRAIHVFRLALIACWLVWHSAAWAQETATITLQLPLPRMGHTLTLQQWNPAQAGYETITLFDLVVTHTQDDGTGSTIPTAASYLEAKGTINLLNDFLLVDETTGETGPPNLFGTPTFQRTSFLTTPWFSDGSASNSFFMTLPEDRAGHVFTLFTQGVSYALSTGPVLGYSTVDGSGQPVTVSYGFFEGWIPTGPPGLYFLVDQSTSEQSNARVPANRDFISNTAWSSFSGALPTRLLTLWLPDSEASNYFELHTSSGSLSWQYPTYASGYDSNGTWHYGWQVSAAMGVNQNFSLVRQLDGATVTGSIGIEDLSLDWTSAFSPYNPPPPPDEPPYQPNWQTISVQVGENHWGETIYFYESNGSVVYPTADWSNQGYLAAYDNNGNEYYRYNYVPYTATIDANYSYWAQDSSGHTSFMDGFNPPYQPNYQNISVQVGENHWSDTLYAHLTTGENVQLQPDWSTQGWQTATDNWGNIYYSYSYVSYTAIVDWNYYSSVVDSAGHTNFMDGFNPPSAPNYQTISVQVGENHWGETVRFHLGDGSTVDAQPDWSTQGAQVASDSTGTEYYRYNFVYYYAYFNVDPGYWVDNSNGHTSLMDGFNPPPLTTASFQVGENHWGHPISVQTSNGLTFTASPDWTNQGYLSATDSQGNAYYYYNWVNYVAAVPENQSISSVSDSFGHTSFMDGFNPPPPPEDFPAVYLQIAASRWQHTLEVHTSSGYVFSVNTDRMQGFWTVDQTSQSWWNSYYFFSATSNSHANQNWWVYDATIGDTAPVNTNDLSNWASPDASNDSDGDGLVDWYEALIGSNPYSTDSDGDGMPDSWEVAHRLNAGVSDGSEDADGDGWTNFEEYLMGTDPRRSTVHITISAPANAAFVPGN